MVGAIVVRAGGTIRQITQQSRARVDVHRKENSRSLEKVITIYGNPENCSTACQKILEVTQQEASNTNRGGCSPEDSGSQIPDWAHHRQERPHHQMHHGLYGHQDHRVQPAR
ncbi:hypothetical protein MRX96_027396 [Rhipicephalus microplus]